MTPKQRRDFEAEWPELAKSLERFLAGKGVPAARREDLVQETATRLLRCWPSVDRSVPVRALACTIALNLLRDEARRVTPCPVAEVPDHPSTYDVELAGIARIELQRVADAMSKMGPAQRAVLLQEVGEGFGATFTTPDAEKMTRLRARRKLTLMLERMSAAVSLRLFRLLDFSGAVVPAKDGALGAMACAACLFVGVGGTVILTSPTAGAVNTARETSRSVQFSATEVAHDSAGSVSSRALKASVVPGGSASKRNLDAATEGTGGKDGSGTRGNHLAGQGQSAGGTSTAPGGGPAGGATNPDLSHGIAEPDASAPDAPSLPGAPGAPATPDTPGAPDAPPAPETVPLPAPGSGESLPEVDDVTDAVLPEVETPGLDR